MSIQPPAVSFQARTPAPTRQRADEPAEDTAAFSLPSDPVKPKAEAVGDKDKAPAAPASQPVQAGAVKAEAAAVKAVDAGQAEAEAATVPAASAGAEAGVLAAMAAMAQEAQPSPGATKKPKPDEETLPAPSEAAQAGPADGAAVAPAVIMSVEPALSAAQPGDKKAAGASEATPEAGAGQGQAPEGAQLAQVGALPAQLALAGLATTQPNTAASLAAAAAGDGTAVMLSGGKRPGGMVPGHAAAATEKPEEAADIVAPQSTADKNTLPGLMALTGAKPSQLAAAGEAAAEVKPVEGLLTALSEPIDLSGIGQPHAGRNDMPRGFTTPEQALPAAMAQTGQGNAGGTPTPLHVVPLEIGLRAMAGARQFDIRLDPGELGRVDVKLEISDAGEVSARLVVDRVETLHLLQRDARTLERAFEQAGLKPSDAGVEISLRDPSDQSGFRQNRQQEEAPRRLPASGDDGQATIIPEQPAPVRRLVRLGGVDLSI